MITTFNCGVGFCLISQFKKIKKNKKVIFLKNINPYIIGKICQDLIKVKLNEKIQSIGLKKIRTAVFISGTGSNLENLIKFSLKKNHLFVLNLLFQTISKQRIIFCKNTK